MNDELRGRLVGIRRQRGDAHERNQTAAEAILDDMRQMGEFVHVNEAFCYYIPTTTRKPIYVTKKSDALEAYLCTEYELNPTEVEAEYVQATIASTALAEPLNGTDQSLSAYREDEQALYIHTGAQELLRIDADRIARVPNGHENMVFQWNPAGDTFDPATKGRARRKWWEYLFHDAVLTATDVEPEEATAVLTAWFLFLLFRQLAASRPIIATLGEPGSGKSVLFKRIYLMLFGPKRGINSISTPANYDMAVAKNPFVCFDNIDITTRWLPDRLAQSSSVTELDVRQLYTDQGIIILRRQALVGVTSHNPEFTRADVADRLLIISLRRWEHHAPEGTILAALRDMRDMLWGGIARTVQDVLGTPIPRPEDAPAMRVQDFSYLGLWFARATGQEAAFVSGLARLGLLQRTFALSEEQTLIEALDKLVLPTGWMPAGEMFRVLQSACRDGGVEFRNQYRNAATLGRRLLTLQHPLKDFFNIQWRHSHKHGREWSVGKPIKLVV